ncbi:hypothetical protein PRZ48_013545 [Zasmidium cellare]|uniref:Uncharacterized protein n=1 Tax=Zasmidium cellare TaxID=395010 RepID=A0ABR0E1V6_ZASCE|nr:hypothetical protein PRZ48_013545 [Zasmidium cellare]
MSESEDVSGRPQYGPPMSPIIFGQTWLRKFNLFYNHRFKTQTIPPSFDWIITLCEQGFDLLLNFHLQAKSHSLTRANFPEEGAPGPLGLQTSKTNPFVKAKALVHMLSGFFERIKLWKEGVWARGMAWQTTPYAERQRFNEALARVEEAKEEGWWDADEEMVRKVTQGILGRENAP